MSINRLTKEQKQYLGLGILITITLVLLVVFGTRFSLTSISEAKAELADLEQKIEDAQRALGTRTRTSEDFGRTMAALRDHLSNLPPDRNYYSWAMEIIYAKASQANLEINLIDEMSMVQSVGATEDAAGAKLEAYSLRIAAQGGYESIKRFLEYMYQDQPSVRVTGIEVSSGHRPDVHDVQIFIQWPFNQEEIRKTWESVEKQQQDMARTTAPIVPEALPMEQAPKLKDTLEGSGGNQ
jgi:hypothetical protein